MHVIRVLTVVLSATAVMLGIPSAASGATRTLKTLTVTANLGSQAGVGKVFVELEIAENRNKLGIPQKLVDVPLTTDDVPAAGTQQLSVPVTTAVLKSAASGMATFEFFAWFGDREATSMASLPVVPRKGSVAATMMGSAQAVDFSSYQVMATPDLRPPPCEWTADGKVVERSNLIGQMQDSKGKGSQVDWDYSTTADSTFGVAVSDDLTKHYSASGSFTITNSLGGSGGFSEGPGFDRYVYGHFYRQRYQSTYDLQGKPVCGHDYKAYYPNAVGDSYPAGKKKPPLDPYGVCKRDPFGIAEMTPKTGSYKSDRGHATTYSAAATIYDVTVSGQTGYTSDIHISYHNHSKLTEYVCGNGTLPDAPKLWSNNSKGH